MGGAIDGAHANAAADADQRPRLVPLTVGIADDDARSLASLRLIVVELVPDASVPWTTTSGIRAVDLCLDESTRPDMLLLDMSLEGLQGPSACRMIREHLDTMPILAITSFALDRYRDPCLRAGAQGLVGKGTERDIAGAIDTIRRTGTYGEGFETCRDAHDRLLHTPRRDDERLSRQEVTVMDMLADDLDDRQIAQRLGISENTVRKHIQHAKVKLHAASRLQAVVRWIKGTDW